eukprot:4717369-Prymnesium_polylepis.1
MPSVSHHNIRSLYGFTSCILRTSYNGQRNPNAIHTRTARAMYRRGYRAYGLLRYALRSGRVPCSFRDVR